MGGKIAGIVPGSIAEEIGIEPGDTLVAINDNPINDLIDYNYYEDGEYLELTIEKANGELWLCAVDKYEDEQIGLIFTANVFDRIRSCANHCLFCFIDQLQPHPRPSLLLKDDDYRMSFMEGNFITCTNLREEDYQRIAKMKLSPLYISVHTVDPLLRQKMLGRKKPAEILLTLQRLISMGCRLHTQIVLCPGINDGEHLAKTLDSLANLALDTRRSLETPEGGVLSIAVVPVGITKYQTNPQLRLFTPQEAGKLIDDIEARQELYRQKVGSRLVFAADELYVKAGRPFPPADNYEDFAQIENGVGMAALYLKRWQDLRASIPHIPAAAGTAVATGTNGAAVISSVIAEINRLSGSDIKLVRVPNTFYGETVTATGLITGTCILNAIAQKQYQRLLIPSNMLKFDEDIFLDDMTVGELESKLEIPIEIVGPQPADLVKALFGPIACQFI